MASWNEISSLATGGGTLVLALATFASVRSANRSARIAEQALQEQRRPVLVNSRMDDPEQKIGFVDGHWLHVPGGGAAAERDGDNIYLSLSLRNVGAGIAVLQGWSIRVGLTRAHIEPTDPDEMRALTRDLYVPGGDIGLWQGALRDPSEPVHREVATAIDARETLSIELFYSDHSGGQRTISRFNLHQVADGHWIGAAGRHWYLDRDGPR